MLSASFRDGRGFQVRMKNVSASTTRSMSGPSLLRKTGFLLVPPEVVMSSETRLQYRVDRLIGEGGFGQVYLATRLSRSIGIPRIVCIKVSQRIDGWLREAYFGQLLDGHPRAIRVYDTFPLMPADGPLLYCLALEYAQHGDLDAFLHRASKRWTETGVRREISAIL